MKKLTLIRHGEVVKSERMILTGSVDLPLTEYGKTEIKNLAGKLHIPPDAALFCSPLTRAVQSADILFEGKKRTILPDLREIDFGLWENKSLKEIAEKNPELLEKWQNDFDNFKFPGGESVTEFINRISSLAGIFLSREEEEIAVVAHKGIITFLICRFLGISYQKYVSFQIDTASFTTLNLFQSNGVLTALNVKL